MTLPLSSAEAPFGYDVCGLRLLSEMDLPGLAVAAEPAPADLRVVRGSVEAPTEWPASGIAVRPTAEADVLAWAGRATLSVSAHEIRVDSDDEGFARQCIVGPGLGVALHRRGRMVLHGSALDVDGKGLVLLGHKGAGKSTTAAALLARGHALLTDDLVAVLPPAEAPLCACGPTQMKLWPSSAQAFGLDVQPFAEGLAKGVWHGARPAPGAVPISLVCSLTWGEAVTLDPLGGPQAFQAVFEHVYAPRFLGPEAASSLLVPCARFCGRVATASLGRPQTLTSVDAVAEALEQALDRL